MLDFKNLNVIELKDLDNDGYSGEFEIEIGTDNNNFNVSDYNYRDITRFPARIRAAATALKLSNLLGVLGFLTIMVFLKSIKFLEI